MAPAEAMERISHRWYLILLEWLGAEWNHPARTDYYLMRIALEIRRIAESFSKKGKAPKLEEFKMVFRAADKQTETREMAAARSKAAWIGRLGGKIRIVKPGETPK